MCVTYIITVLQKDSCLRFQMSCELESKCIPLWMKCDGHVDCGDKSDEPESCRKSQ